MQNDASNGEEIHVDKLHFATTALNHIQDQIRLSDTKAGAFAALAGLMTGHVLTQTLAYSGGSATLFPSAGVYSLIPPCVFGASVVLTLLYSLVAIYPRKSAENAQSPVYFDSVASRYGKDIEGYVKRITEQSEAELTNDVAREIVQLSIVCKSKYSATTKAAKWLIVAVICWATITAISFAGGISTTTHP